ncbi:flavin monooxygenase-like protein [Phlyctochytrium arcticum]|nr:flavin monooxygenase-like protein [Phlyctochytrium arcticum]KAI9090267.1 flavin monooxygenase-like protein [Phlyctochytrium arcticum]
MPSTAAVIGAGPSGLVACKELVAAGFSVTVYDRGDRIGGLWAYSEDPQQPSVMRQTVLNLSRAQMVFSDFPFSKDHPHYPTHQAYEEYLESYARHFDLYRHIRFQTSVTAVQPIENGRWIVSSKSTDDTKSTEDTFDRLVVAAGQNQVPFMPQTPGLQDFKGTIIHSVNYKTHEPFNGARALVVGVANSGADVAVDLAGNAETVFMSGRHGIWLFPRFLLYGKPLDHMHSRKSLEFPSWMTDFFMRCLSRFMVGDLSKFRLNSNIRPTTINPVVNDHLASHLATGRVLSRPDIKQLHPNEVEFVDGTRGRIDTIIYCTGFQRVFPFLPSLTMTGQTSPGSPTLSLYKRIIPIQHPTLAFVGHIHGLALPAVAELQARWVARLFSGSLNLPSQPYMQQEIDQHFTWTAKNTHGKLSTCEVPAFAYMESLAADIGCRPKTSALWWHKPQLRKLVISGTFNPHQYRLSGHGMWEGAENAVFDVCGVEKSRRWGWLARFW